MRLTGVAVWRCFVRTNFNNNMKRKFPISPLSLLLFVLALGWYGCEVKDDATPTKTAPTGLETITVAGITGSGAFISCNIASNGGEDLISKGVIYSSTNNAPTETDGTEFTTSGTDVAAFTVTLTGLVGNTKYYVRAFAKNSVGYGLGPVKEFTTLNDGSAGTVTDIDGNVYSAITIGTQTWMKSNLKVKRYRNGGSIQANLSSTQWKGTSAPAYASYNDNSSNDASYGKLYNWYTVSSGSVCPTGWHVPSETEWNTLTDFLGGDLAGGKMKSVSNLWTAPNVNATNSSGFSALPGGRRVGSDGSYSGLGTSGLWWTSNTSVPLAILIENATTKVLAVDPEKRDGLSIRCIKD